MISIRQLDLDRILDIEMHLAIGIVRRRKATKNLGMKVMYEIILIIIIISNLSNDRSKASSKMIPPHSAI